MVYTVDFKEVATIGLESSPVAPALAGLRANEARYFGINTNIALRPSLPLKLQKHWPGLKNFIRTRITFPLQAT